MLQCASDNLPVVETYLAMKTPCFRRENWQKLKTKKIQQKMKKKKNKHEKDRKWPASSSVLLVCLKFFAIMLKRLWWAGNFIIYLQAAFNRGCHRWPFQNFYIRIVVVTKGFISSSSATTKRRVLRDIPKDGCDGDYWSERGDINHDHRHNHNESLPGIP